MNSNLKRAGYTVDQAHNGAVALAKMKKKTYDMVLMDLQMPVMDGCTAVALFREFEASSLPLLSADLHQRDAAAIRASRAGEESEERGGGAAGFIPESLSRGEILSDVGISKAIVGSFEGNSSAPFKTGAVEEEEEEEEEESSATAEIRRRRQLIIGMSANIDSATRGQALAAGMNAFLSKPFKLEEALQVMRTLSSGAP